LSWMIHLLDDELVFSDRHVHLTRRNNN